MSNSIPIGPVVAKTKKSKKRIPEYDQQQRDEQNQALLRLFLCHKDNMRNPTDPSNLRWHYAQNEAYDAAMRNYQVLFQDEAEATRKYSLCYRLALDHIYANEGKPWDDVFCDKFIDSI